MPKPPDAAATTTTAAPIATPRPAATIILCRPSADAGANAFEVLLLKRHGKSGFMAGAHVFPGGRVDESDAALAKESGQALAAHAARTIDAVAHPAEGVLFLLAAVRETKEEAGIDVDPHALAPWSWWITPKEEPKRFDTRFFIAPVPAGTVEHIDDHEAVASAWLTPQAALDAYDAGSIVLAPPTYATLEDLVPYRTIEDAVASVQRPLRPICPRITTLPDGAMVLALPGDPLHDERAAVFPKRLRFVVDERGRFRSA